MGAGKTTIGRELSKKLGWKFTDLDELLVRRAKKSVAAIFATEGEAGFRQRESQMLLEVIRRSSKQAVVIALGGGAFVQPNNFEAIRQSGCKTIHLDADLATLSGRCHREGKVRPLLQDENQFRQLYEERRSGYMKADHRVDTAGKSVCQIVTEIMLQLGFTDEFSEESRIR
jgi:shikimate kinase